MDAMDTLPSRGSKGLESRLAMWRGRLAAMSRNVSDLDDEAAGPSCAGLRLRIRSVVEPSGTPVSAINLTDAEARTWGAVRGELWECIRLVGGALDRAEQAGRTTWPWQREQAADTACTILDTGLVELSLADVPVLRRGLLGGSTDKMQLTLDAMLDVMEKAFERGKTTLGRLLDTERQVIDRLKHIDTCMSQMNKDGTTAEGAAISLMDAVRSLAVRDPLRALQEMEEKVLPVFDGAMLEATRQRGEMSEAASLVNIARQELIALDDAREKAVAQIEAAGKLVHGLPTPPARTSVLELYAWLDRLDKLIAAGKMSAWRAGFTSWRLMLTNATACMQAACLTAADLLRRREEARGRYDATVSKFSSRRRAGFTDVHSADDAEAASRTALMGTVHVREAEAMLRIFELAVNGMERPVDAANGKIA